MRWPPYSHIFFDCDSTLTTVEGIDVLAKNAGKLDRIRPLTEAAMNGEIELEAVYGKRLAAINPTRSQVTAIREEYKGAVVEDARQLISALTYLGHEVYIISGGLLEPVREFGVFLGVPASHIRAVAVDYDHLSGDWWLGDQAQQNYLTHQQGALTVSDGKAEVVRQLLGEKSGRSLLVGDGVSDLRAQGEVDLFVGYGGVFARDKVIEQAPVSIHSASLAPLLLIASGFAAGRRLQDTPHFPLFQKAEQLYLSGELTFQNERLSKKFKKARKAFYSRSR